MGCPAALGSGRVDSFWVLHVGAPTDQTRGIPLVVGSAVGLWPGEEAWASFRVWATSTELRSTTS